MNRIFVVLLVLFLVCICFSFYDDMAYRRSGDALIQKIETYRRDNKRLPVSLKELSIDEGMGEGPYYEIIDSANYKVYFNIGFDKSLIYYSDTREWEDEP